jgi:hypothetical protein
MKDGNICTILDVLRIFKDIIISVLWNYLAVFQGHRNLCSQMSGMGVKGISMRSS